MRMFLSTVALTMFTTVSYADVTTMTPNEAFAVGVELGMTQPLEDFEEFGLLSVIAVACVDSKKHNLSQTGVEVAKTFGGMSNVGRFKEGVESVDPVKASLYDSGVKLGLSILFEAKSDEHACEKSKMVIPMFFTN